MNSQGSTKYLLTVILLCAGYFIDFYDLTTFSSSYASIIRDSFSIYDELQIQQLYLKISSIYNVGIVIGCILFGVLGDKYGRATMIRYSILFYSICIIACVYTKSVAIFTFLRFLSGIGLASEFSTSSVLISELLSPKVANRSTGLMYCAGIFGGITATYFGKISWQFMFLFGGFVGILLFILRKNMLESALFQGLDKYVRRGNLLQIFNSPQSIFRFVRLALLIIPYFFLITAMFIYPRFMDFNGKLSALTTTLLFGFFTGNIISILLSNVMTNFFKDYTKFLFVNYLLFIITMVLFPFVTNQLFLPYSILLGLLGGGLPVVWVQLVTRSYGTNLRCTATNLLGACGRGSATMFNLLIAYWLKDSASFTYNAVMTVIIITCVSFISLYYTNNNFNATVVYVE